MWEGVDFHLEGPFRCPVEYWWTRKCLPSIRYPLLGVPSIFVGLLKSCIGHVANIRDLRSLLERHQCMQICKNSLFSCRCHATSGDTTSSWKASLYIHPNPPIIRSSLKVKYSSIYVLIWLCILPPLSLLTPRLLVIRQDNYNPCLYVHPIQSLYWHIILLRYSLYIFFNYVQ